jgi:hypothetical protein
LTRNGWTSNPAFRSADGKAQLQRGQRRTEPLTTRLPRCH